MLLGVAPKEKQHTFRYCKAHIWGLEEYHSVFQSYFLTVLPHFQHCFLPVTSFAYSLSAWSQVVAPFMQLSSLTYLEGPHGGCFHGCSKDTELEKCWLRAPAFVHEFKTIHNSGSSAICHPWSHSIFSHATVECKDHKKGHDPNKQNDKAVQVLWVKRTPWAGV